jgi:GH25 family lysozyme M1 (1,4-beta-N-acetylmuramidase)
MKKIHFIITTILLFSLSVNPIFAVADSVVSDFSAEENSVIADFSATSKWVEENLKWKLANLKGLSAVEKCTAKYEIFHPNPTEPTQPTEPTTPPKTEWKGIDVSHHQGVIDWEKLSKDPDVEFVMIRAGYGKDVPQQIDKQFESNLAGAKKYGIPYGIYWYSYAMSAEGAIAEANACISTMKKYNAKPTYPVMYDVENGKSSSGSDTYNQTLLSKQVVTAMMKNFCNTLISNGYRAGIYSYKDFLLAKVDESVLKTYPVWVAQWGDKNTYPYEYAMWQYSNDGEADGISGRICLNLAFTDYATNTT